jgi:hypothetical protein
MRRFAPWSTDELATLMSILGTLSFVARVLVEVIRLSRSVSARKRTGRPVGNASEQRR